MEIINKSFEFLDYDIYLRNPYIKKIEEFSDTKNITIITGQRRVGKSFVVAGFLKKHKINIKNCFYLNKEFDINNDIKDSKDLNTLFETYKKQHKEPEYIIIDEIQDIKDWEFFVRWVYASKKYKIIITWSNSKLLSSELSTFLTGRFLSFEVFSFTYQEFLWFLEKKKGKESFAEYANFWGLPEVLLQRNDILKTHYLKSTIDTMIYQDIIKRYEVKNQTLAEKILKFLAENIGNLTSLRNIEKYIMQEKLKVSVATISKYVKYFENAYLIKKADRIWLKWKEYFKFIGKYYFSDVGLRNILIGSDYSNISQILENIVYNYLSYLDYEIKIGTIWEKEIDFVATKWKEKKYIQVCYILAEEKTRKREFGNLLEIDDNFEKIVISTDETGNFDYKWVKWMNIIDFLTNFNV
jgi:uncharacterized protein